MSIKLYSRTASSDHLYNCRMYSWRFHPFFADKKRPQIPPSASPPNEPLKVPKREEVSPGSMQSPEGSQSTPGPSYSERTNSGAVLTEVKSSRATDEGASATGMASLSDTVRRCTIGHLQSDDGTDEAAVGIQGPFRYMFTTTEQRAAALDRSFKHSEEQLLKHSGLPAEALSLRAPVGMPSQDAIVCFGRVCCEAAEGKINKTSVVLEGGRMEGGQRVKLVLNELATYALFPGQYVVVEGINSSGGRMVVRKLLEGVPRAGLVEQQQLRGDGTQRLG